MASLYQQDPFKVEEFLDFWRLFQCIYISLSPRRLMFVVSCALKKCFPFKQPELSERERGERNDSKAWPVRGLEWSTAFTVIKVSHCVLKIHNESRVILLKVKKHNIYSVQQYLLESNIMPKAFWCVPNSFIFWKPSVDSFYRCRAQNNFVQCNWVQILSCRLRFCLSYTSWFAYISDKNGKSVMLL